MDKRPKVGVGVIVKKNGKVLLGKRKNAHGEGSWCFPGGHLEFNETFEDCAKRETKEETGITITDIMFGTATNDIFTDENKHYVTVFMVANHESGEASVKEQEKCERWGWFTWDNLPEPLFIPIQNLLSNGYDPFKK